METKIVHREFQNDILDFAVFETENSIKIYGTTWNGKLLCFKYEKNFNRLREFSLD